ncbi:hypothetical protein [Methylobacterium goesingense]|uniref:Anti-sigma factor NepR domain-containing protein n=1 Tax=Methylobacterium goesingense TaxID=243690 RepID=A0ABV2L8N6_9HYPH|nr:hypothetical protein [Methylobacterium goesingense]GJD76515.1 hypothetical protein CFIICLFH_4773 [Methylobacterium goesingense]
MSDIPTPPVRPYPSFEDPPPRAACTDALLGRVIRRLFEVGARHEDGLAGALHAVLATLDHRMTAAGKPSR